MTMTIDVFTAPDGAVKVRRIEWDGDGKLKHRYHLSFKTGRWVRTPIGINIPRECILEPEVKG